VISVSSTEKMKWDNRKFKRIEALQVLSKSKRFDLIFKYLYVKNMNSVHSNFYKELYLLSIKHMNNFREADPLNHIKTSKKDFLDAFSALARSIKSNGFDESKGEITITSDGDLWAGAHRLAVSAYHQLNVRMGIIELKSPYDYEFFQTRQLPVWAADLAALEFVKFSQFAFVATLHSCVPESKIEKIEEIIKQKCKIYYKKDIFLDFNSYVNLKKISYLGDTWLGDIKNGFAGAFEHAKESFGVFPVRVYVLICDSESLLVPMKSQIREECCFGNYSIHITDNRIESIRMAELLLQETSLSILKIPYKNIDYCREPDIIKRFKSYLQTNNKLLNDYCVVGSTSLDILQLRKARDLDFITVDEIQNNLPPKIDNHGHEDDLYFGGTTNQIVDPRCHFFYSGIKFLSLGSLIFYKSRRLEKPKDINDISFVLGGVSRSSSSPVNTSPVYLNSILKKYTPDLIKKIVKRLLASSVLKKHTPNWIKNIVRRLLKSQ